MGLWRGRHMILRREIVSLMNITTNRHLTLFEIHHLSLNETWYEVMSNQTLIQTFIEKEMAYDYFEQYFHN